MIEECTACGMLIDEEYGGMLCYCAECGLTFCPSCMADGQLCVVCAADDFLDDEDY